VKHLIKLKGVVGDRITVVYTEESGSILTHAQLVINTHFPTADTHSQSHILII
jgi:hypothetical protein